MLASEMRGMACALVNWSICVKLTSKVGDFAALHINLGLRYFRVANFLASGV